MAQQDGPLAVAVSGGGDSLALMHLLSAFAKAHKLKSPIVLTVDHGLRKTSGKEARQVAAWAKKAGLAAYVLSWRGAKPKSGVEAAAREARYRLMGDWLARHKIAALYVGHTIDDQAETFLLRLARGSGLDGLAAMRARAPWPVPGFPLLSVARPLLGITRGDLRVYLTALGQAWQDDPMNEDAAFDRVKIRKARGALADLGLTPSRIAAAATHLARARAALETVTEAVLARAAGKGQAGVLLDPAVLAAAPREVGLRALAAMLMAVSGQPYRPRFDALERLFDKVVAGSLGKGATLHGCHIGPASKGQAELALLVRPENPRKTGGSLKNGKVGA
ncbi:MAG: tRNA(Ile)-lysidine synthase [Pseudomonadota bacterium]|jgi:tRNA(Ile)-lysidine synthase